MHSHPFLSTDMQCVSHTERDRDAINRAIFLVVMGVSGTDGDDLHPPSNIAKMSRGEALTDGDRRPWLYRIRQTAVKHILDQLGAPVSTDFEPGDKPETKGAMSDKFEEEGMPEEWRRPGVIVACSALKKTYRDVLRGLTRSSTSNTSPCEDPSPELDAVAAVPTTLFVFLKGSKEVLMDRMQKREGHFMKAQMLESQLNTLESPEDEPGVITVSIESSTEEQMQHVLRAIHL